MSNKFSGYILPVLLFLVLASPTSGGAQTLRVDLGKMSQRMEIRYYIAEKGKLPPQYILFHNSFLYPNFLQAEFDRRKEVVEYDPHTGYVFRFKVPREYSFVRKQMEDEVYIRMTERELARPGLDIDILSPVEGLNSLGKKKFRQVWREEIAVNLGKEWGKRRRGGLLDFDIPISLPKQIEWLIGDGEETHLSVRGSEEITIGGTSRWKSNYVQSEGRTQQQKFPDLDMEQKLNVTLDGTVGEKIKVKINHSNRGAMGSVNKVNVHYEGFEDDVIKYVEIGNTDLTLPGTQLVKSTSSQGLFGVKVKGQVGPLDLTVIAAKEEGESSSGSYLGRGGQSQEQMIADYQYAKRQFFYLETPGRDIRNPIPGYLKNVEHYYPAIGYGDSLEVFRSINPMIEWSLPGNKYYVLAYPDSLNNGLEDDINPADIEQNCEPQWYVLLEEGRDFDLIQVNDGGTEPKYCGIRLVQPLPNDKLLAVRYVSTVRVGAGYNYVPLDTIGNYGFFPAIDVQDPGDKDEIISNKEYLVAELICPMNSESYPPGNYNPPKPYTSTWNMMWRNVYYIGTGFGVSRIEVEIRDKTIVGATDPTLHPQTRVPFLRLFGLDRYNNSKGNLEADGLIDNKDDVLNLGAGYIQFPDETPFYFSLSEWEAKQELAFNLNADLSDSTENALVDSLFENFKNKNKVEAIGRIYNEADTWSADKVPHSFDIVIRSESGGNTFRINAFDIIENSVTVVLDGRRLSEGRDFEVDYAMGEVRLKGDAAASVTADSDVQIEYQHKPMIGGGRTSLLGIGADLNLSTNTRLSGTFLYNSVGAQKYAPRLGEEPTRTMAADVNGSFVFRPRWMTSLINLLPRIDTDGASSLELSGEAAVSIPNPNTKGEALVDDMEGVEDSDQISLARSQWYEASPPLDPASPDIPLPPDTVEYYWFNPNNSEKSHTKDIVVETRDLNPRLQKDESVLSSAIFLKAFNPKTEDWCGVMTGFPGGLDIRNAQYLELWVNDFNVDADSRRGTLHIDFGNIDEDFFQPQEDDLDDEEIVNWNQIEDDFGFSGESAKKFPYRYPYDNFEGSYDATKKVYVGVNSRIMNSIHDTEDLNRNGRLDTKNQYYSLSLNLSDSALIDVWEDFRNITSYWNDPDEGEIHSLKRWRMYRLDLSKALAYGDGTPRLDAVQHMRVWIENVDSLQGQTHPSDLQLQHVLAITRMKFVGNRWEFDDIRDLEGKPIPVPGAGSAGEMVVKVGSINNKDNPSLYYSPYQVEKEGKFEIREQSLLFTVENFAEETSFRTVKQFYGRGRNFQQYRELQFFVRGDEEMIPLGADSTCFYLQIARDSSNYYEIEVPLISKDRGKWLWVNVQLSDLTNLKIGNDTSQLVEKYITDVVDPSRRYIARVLGEPTLDNVQVLYSGVRNRTGMMIGRGQLWLNDLALGNVRKNIDHAERISVSGAFSNIMNWNASWNHSGPDFHKLNQSTGSGLSTDNYSFGGKTDISHFVPTARFRLPVTFGYSVSTSKPKYMPNSDVEINSEAVRDSMKSVSKSYRYSLSMRRSGSSNFIMKNLFDNLTLGGNVSWKKSYSAYSADTSYTMQWDSKYNLNFDRDRVLMLPFGLKWRYWLTNFSYGANGSRSLRDTYSYSGGRKIKKTPGRSHGWNNSMQLTYQPFDFIKKITYNRKENRDLMEYREFHGLPVGNLFDFREETRIDFTPGNNFFFLSQFRPTFDYTARYHENIKPGIRQGDDPVGTRDIDASRSINITFDVDVGDYAIKFGKFARIFKKSESIGRGSGAGSRRSLADRPIPFDKKYQPPRTSDGPVEIVPIPDLDKRFIQPETPQEPSTAAETGDKDTATPATSGEEEGAFADLGKKRPRGPLDGKLKPGEEEKPDAKKSAAADSVKVKTGDPLLLVRNLLRFVGRIDPLHSTIKINENNNYKRLHDRADIAYRLGINKASGAVGPSGEVEDTPYYWKRDLRFMLNTGMDLTSNIDAVVRYSLSRSTEIRGGTTNESDNITWPDVTLSVGGVEKWRLFGKYLKTSSLTIGYKKMTMLGAMRERNSTQLTPSWSVTWHNGLSVSLLFTYKRETTINKLQEIWNKSWSTNLNFKYNIKTTRGFGVPLPLLNKKRIRFKSELRMVMDISYSVVESYDIPPINSLSVAPSLSYQFSRSVTGNLNIRYSRSAGGITNIVNNEVGLHATAKFEF
ncbi:MAG: hypothetical protein JXB45_11290 [Candidatus Krumholzibacteriota bacterium]|nr:hypothetical protein [Candidatus Krumholzibacteriota bacterium]